MIVIAEREMPRSGDVIGLAMAEVDHGGGEQQADAGSEANRPSDQRRRRVESDAGEPAGRPGEYARARAHHRLRQTNTDVTT